jgi:hypothetical protein
MDADKSDDTSPGTSHVAIVGTSVCRAVQDHVVAKDVVTGRTLWEIPLGGLISGLTPLADTYLGVYYAGSHLAVVAVDRGVIVKDLQVDDLALPPVDVTLDHADDSSSLAPNARLLLFARTKQDPPNYVLASYPMSDGPAPWRRDLGRLAAVNRRMLRASPNYIAVIQYQINLDSSRAQQMQGFLRTGSVMNAARLMVLDKTNNHSLLEEPFSFDRGEANQLRAAAHHGYHDPGRATIAARADGLCSHVGKPRRRNDANFLRDRHIAHAAGLITP